MSLYFALSPICFDNKLLNANLYLINISPQYGNGTISSLSYIDGEQGESWMQSSSSFPSTTDGVRFKITGKRGRSYVSDIAIDDLSVGNCAGMYMTRFYVTSALLLYYTM